MGRIGRKCLPILRILFCLEGTLIHLHEPLVVTLYMCLKFLDLFERLLILKGHTIVPNF